MPALRARSSHFATSALTKAVKTSGVFGSGSAPCSASRCLRIRQHEDAAGIGADLVDDIARRARPARTGRTSRATGSPAGPSRRRSENPGTAPSAPRRSCRSHAACRRRCAASPRRRGENIRSMRPPSRSVTAGPVPRYGTCSISMPAICMNSAPERCDAEPTPDEPKLSLPGLALAWAISSAVLRTGSAGLTTRM